MCPIHREGIMDRRMYCNFSSGTNGLMKLDTVFHKERSMQYGKQPSGNGKQRLPVNMFAKPGTMSESCREVGAN